jgi:hypothetical protein
MHQVQPGMPFDARMLSHSGSFVFKAAEVEAHKHNALVPTLAQEQLNAIYSSTAALCAALERKKEQLQQFDNIVHGLRATAGTNNIDSAALLAPACCSLCSDSRACASRSRHKCLAVGLLGKHLLGLVHGNFACQCAVSTCTPVLL